MFYIYEGVFGRLKKRLGMILARNINPKVRFARTSGGKMGRKLSHFRMFVVLDERMWSVSSSVLVSTTNPSAVWLILVE
ncbi:hypothetical protein E2C01_043635 [Portunus trituberculatus]|uniref:Uncharacterized protein n=1 Tax=Portunus trituberculatus TaxID=210409 RepID=A0A5B7FQS7_PORTR|nr:hypothetical protein [Portunus trituberculatus]